jgi:hypothetical protein
VYHTPPSRAGATIVRVRTLGNGKFLDDRIGGMRRRRAPQRGHHDSEQETPSPHASYLVEPDRGILRLRTEWTKQGSAGYAPEPALTRLNIMLPYDGIGPMKYGRIISLSSCSTM